MRIIQDSEDEDDLEVEGIAAGEQLCDALPNHNSDNNSVEPGAKGTGSTESLKRAIVKAHHAQFRDDAASAEFQNQRNPSELSVANDAATGVSARTATDSSISFSGHASKRRRTSLDGAVALSSARDVSSVSHADSHNGHAGNFNNTHSHHTQGKLWNPQETMQDHWAHHEPMALFTHSGSSTIPNATATQQQLLAEVLAPAFLGIDQESSSQHYEAPKYEPAKSSVPWSEYLKSSSEAQLLHESAEQQSPALSNNESTPADLTTERTLFQDSKTEFPQPLVRSPSRPVVEPLSDDEQPANEAAFQSSPDPIVSPRNSAKQLLNPELNLEDDFSAIGAPTEQYKPRPSRSRSSILVGQESIDYSKRPEASMRKARRTRTSGDVESVSSATTPEKVRQICDMGFTPTTTRKALRQHNGDVTHTVNWLVAAGIADGDQQPSSESLRSDTKRKSKRKLDRQGSLTETDKDKSSESVVEAVSTSVEAAHSTTEHHAPEHTLTSTVTKSPTIVKVVIPRTAKPVVTQPKMDGLELDSPPVDQIAKEVAEEVIKGRDTPPEGDINPTLGEAPKGKKRGRGRPKKETKLTGPDEDKPQEQTRTLIPPVQEELADIKDNGSETPVALDTDVNENQTKKLDDVEQHPTTPRVPPEKKVKQASEAPSAISKPKTPYRVGLSKRARITPLLRVVKK